MLPVQVSLYDTSTLLVSELKHINHDLSTGVLPFEGEKDVTQSGRLIDYCAAAAPKGHAPNLGSRNSIRRGKMM